MLASLGFIKEFTYQIDYQRKITLKILGQGGADIVPFPWVAIANPCNLLKRLFLFRGSPLAFHDLNCIPSYAAFYIPTSEQIIARRGHNFTSPVPDPVMASRSFWSKIHLFQSPTFLPHREVIPIPENHLSVLAQRTVLFVLPSCLNFWDWYDN